MQITEDRLNDVIKNPAGFKSEKSTIKFLNKGVNLKGNDGKLCEVFQKAVLSFRGDSKVNFQMFFRENRPWSVKSCHNPAHRQKGVNRKGNDGTPCEVPTL